jgi:hypothetical protein
VRTQVIDAAPPAPVVATVDEPPRDQPGPQSDASPIRFVYDDGGRAAAGFKGEADDCVVRAISIAMEKPYREVYGALTVAQRQYAESHRGRVAERIRKRGVTPRNGAWKQVYRPYLEALGWAWTPTMQVGSGCTVHLDAAELPSGRLIVSVSRHLVAMIDGVVHDTHDPARDGTRCVYGYFSAPKAAPIARSIIEGHEHYSLYIDDPAGDWPEFIPGYHYDIRQPSRLRPLCTPTQKIPFCQSGTQSSNEQLTA